MLLDLRIGLHLAAVAALALLYVAYDALGPEPFVLVVLLVAFRNARRPTSVGL